MADPDVSVVIPTFHRPQRLRRALGSVLGQSLNASVEVIVALSDPADPADRAAAEFPGVRVVDAVAPGPAGARNAGIRASRGRLLALLDDDCVAAEGWLAAGVDALEEAGIVQGVTRPEAPPPPFARSVWVERPSGLWEACNLFVRRECVDAAGFFDEDWSLTGDPRDHMGEDVEWGWRVVRRGAVAGFCANARVFHAVEPRGATAMLRERARLRHWPALVRRVPEVRRHMVGGVLLNRRHAVTWPATLALAVGAAAIHERRTQAGLVLLAAGALGWLEPMRRARTPRAALHQAVAISGDAVAMVALLEGSLRHRSPVL